MLLGGSIVIVAATFFFDLSYMAFLLLIPSGLFVFALSLIIGYFLSEPLRMLEKTMRVFLEGGKRVGFSARGQLYEADTIAECFDDIIEVSKKQKNELSLKEKRQTDFISDVAHELRTPLTAIHGTAEMLLDPDLPADMRKKFCTIIIDESERLGRLSNDLLTLQHLEGMTMPMELQRVNLSNLSREVIDSLKPYLNNLDINVRVLGESPDVLGDPDRLKQVISNLVENASRFVDPGGHITIELFGMKSNSVLAIKDDGLGFGDVDPKLLFTRFYRTDTSRSRETGGSGLGLSIVKSIVESHDGSVEAFNLPEGGACFIVALPSIAGS